MKYTIILLTILSVVGISWISYNDDNRMRSTLQVDESNDSIPGKPKEVYNQKKSGEVKYHDYKDWNPKLEVMKQKIQMEQPVENVILKTEKAKPSIKQSTTPVLTTSEKQIKAIKSKLLFLKEQNVEEENLKEIEKLEKRLEELEK